MKAQLTTTRNGYGFGHDWMLNVTTDKTSKQFYLGQDAKFCIRVLGMRPADVVAEIGDNDLSNPETLQRLCDFIIEQLELTEERVDNLQEWELCCQ